MLMCGSLAILFSLVGIVSGATSDEQEENAVSFYLPDTTLAEWTTVETTFKTQLASESVTFCAYNLADCNVDTSYNLTLSANDVIFLPEYPMEAGPHVQIAFTVQLPADEVLSLPALIPQPQLQNIVLINQATLESVIEGPMVAVSAYEVHVASPSVVVPTVAQPTEEDIRNNAILIILDRASITLWHVGDLESTFKGAVVAVASDHCSSNPASCNVETSSDSRRKRSEDVFFDEGNIHIIPDYPQAVGEQQLEIAFAVGLPSSVTVVEGVTERVIPQSTLLLIALQLSPVLAELSGAYVIGISAYQTTEPPSTADNISQIVSGVVVPSVLLVLTICGLIVGVPIICLKGKYNRDLYNVTNYVRGPNENVKMIAYRRLKGVWSETESDDVDCNWMGELEEEWMGEMDENWMGEMEEDSL